MNVYFSESPESVLTSDFIDRRRPLVMTGDALSSRRLQTSAPLSAITAGGVLDTLICLLSTKTRVNSRCISSAASYPPISDDIIVRQIVSKTKKGRAAALVDDDEEQQELHEEVRSMVIRALEITTFPFVNGLIITLSGSFLMCLILLMLGKGKPKQRTRKVRPLTDQQLQEQMLLQQNAQLQQPAQLAQVMQVSDQFSNTIAVPTFNNGPYPISNIAAQPINPFNSSRPITSCDRNTSGEESDRTPSTPPMARGNTYYDQHVDTDNSANVLKYKYESENQ